MTTTLDCGLFRDLWGSAGMRECFGTRAMMQGWLDAESALAFAEAEVGVIPAEAAARIGREARAELYDVEALRSEIAASRHPLVPLIRALVERCGEHGAFVHWGATTQDIMDTGMMLQCRQGLEVLVAVVARATEAAYGLAQAHRYTVMAGRTHGQHAVPITAGLKMAGWTDELTRVQRRLVECRERALCVQLGGAGGTLASLGADADRVLIAFGRRLGLETPAVPWFAARDRVRDMAHAVSELAGAGERIAAEVVRLQATEVGEVKEGAQPDHVGSSTMPQKRNPMMCEYLVASCRLLRGSAGALCDAVAHAGERDMGLWAVEWLAVPQIFIIAGGIADKLVQLLEHLEVAPRRMRANVDASGDSLMAEAAMMRLARTIGHERAHMLVTAAVKRAHAEERTLVDVLRDEKKTCAAIQRADLDVLADPGSYLGWAPGAADRLAFAPTTKNEESGDERP